MKFNLKTTREAKFQLHLSTRLPTYILESCELLCEYRVQTVSDYFLLTYSVLTPAHHPLSISCQRCLQPFFYLYANTITLAVCKSEEQAEILSGKYECIVTPNNQVDFMELLTDDLYLYVPKNHPDSRDCDEEVSQFIQ